MGGGGKTQQTSQKTEIPPEVMARYNAVNARAETVANTPFQQYSQNPDAFVAPLTQTQQAGIQNTNMMAGAAQPYYGAAAGLTAAGAQGVNPGNLNVGQYYNPYTQAVAAPTLQALQQQQGTERSSLMNPNSMRSYGGDRSGIVAANLARQQALGTAQVMNPIYKDAYNQALQTAIQQQGLGLTAEQANAQRLMAAGAQFGQLGTGAQAAGLAGAQAQMGAGATEQQTQQAGLQALYNQFQQARAYPIQMTQMLAGIAEGTGPISGQTVTGTQPAGFFSDERLKENIQRVGETDDGQPIYRYNYKGDKRTQIGLLAQDVEKHHPEAVGLAGGYKTVDYKKATQDAIHKDEGGPVEGAPQTLGGEKWDIAGPTAKRSALPMNLQGLGAARPFAGSEGLPIMAQAYDVSGMMAPKAKGLTLGAMEGMQAQRASLPGSGPGGDPAYRDWLMKDLDAKIAAGGGQPVQMASAAPNMGGTPYTESFSAGGLAGGERYGFSGEMGSYVNPALAYYQQMAAKGLGSPYGVNIQPRSGSGGLPKQPDILKQQPSGLAQAANAAETGSKLATIGKSAWDNRPDFAKSQATLDAEKRNAEVQDAIKFNELAKAKALGFEYKPAATGGLIRGHYDGSDGSYVMPYSDEEDPLAKAAAIKHEPSKGLQGGSLPKPGPSDAEQLGGLASKGLAAQKAGTALAGKMGLMGGETALGSGIGGTAVGAGEAAAGLAGAGEAAAGTAAAAEGAGMLGSLGTGLAAAGTTAMEVLPFLALLSDKRAKHDIKKVGELYDGQPVYRYAYNGDDRMQMGLLAQNVEKDHPEAVGLAGGYKTVDYKAATNDAAKRHGYQSAGLVRAVRDAPGFGAVPEDTGSGSDILPEMLAKYERQSPEDIEAVIQRFVPKNTMAESGGRNVPNAAGASTAFGPGQFTKDTWKDAIKRDPAFKDLTEADRYNPDAQARVMPSHARYLASRFQDSELPVNEGNLRLGWAMGHAGGPAFAKAARDNPDAPAYTVADPAAVKANPTWFFDDKGNPRTVAEAQSHLVSQLDRKPGVASGKPSQSSGLAGGSAANAARSPFQALFSGALPDMSPSTKAALSSENLWVPALAGIGSMLASQRPTLGGAVGEGLVGGAGAYTALQKQQADIEKKNWETEQIRAGITTGSLTTDIKGRQVIRYLKPDNTYDLMEVVDYWKLPKDQRPRLDPGSQRKLDEMESTLGGGAGGASDTGKQPEKPVGSTTPPPGGAGGAGGNPPPGGSVTPPAPGGASSSSPPPDQEAATAPAIRLDDAMRKAAADKAEAMYRAGTDATAAYPDKIGPAIDAAASAQNQRAPLGSLANSLASAPRTESPLASGKVQEIAQPIMAVANNLASMFGIRAPAPDADLSSAELIRKNIKLLAKEASVGSLAHAAFVDMENAIPTNLNSPDAQAKMLADIFTINQRIIDRGNFHKQLRDAANGPDQRYIAQAPHAASSLDPDAEFSKRYSQAFYNDEKKALIRMFKDGPKGMTNAQGRQMSMYEYLHEKGASLSPQEKAKIGKALGSPNIMRYFGLGD